MKKEEMDPLHFNSCMACGYSAATAVLRVESNERLGWYCPQCKGFTKAHFREARWVSREDWAKFKSEDEA